ncbi:hypothetical protein I6A60_06030 [Frankia sp. AgB1.9]|uniref:hypothetical protein n=1 Tax=unclassified Frankia TaxID=2632575 RepID=UPI001932059B|nr:MULTISPECIES: hypothetical protein [unclassified Frankia]MBL7487477.1 hypothetical protein [Frankia sp. AgW1.1]MBL7547439.1 hypothetical protein [Frankia sp. AgB1.9]MBL7618786.1 hypothetical protein [Frankia sp. AgB1.8]
MANVDRHRCDLGKLGVHGRCSRTNPRPVHGSPFVVFVAAALLTSGVTACGVLGKHQNAAPAPEAPISIAAGTRPAAKVVDLGGGARVVFADAPVSGSQLTVATDSPPPNLDDRRSLATPVKLTLTGSDLGSGATLDFPLPDSLRAAAAANPDVVGIATYDEASRQWVPVQVSVHDGLVSAVTTHFSWWQPWTWDWAALGATVNQAVGQLVDKRAGQASCDRGEGVPSWVASTVGVSNDPALEIRSCAQGQNGVLDVELVNNRPYGMVLRYGSAVKWGWHEDGGTPLEQARNKLMDALLAGGKGLYLPPLGRASVGIPQVTAGQYVTFPASVTGATLLTDLAYTTAGDLVEDAGASLAGPLQSECATYAAMTVAADTLGSPKALHEKLIDAADCLEKAYFAAVRSGLLDQARVAKVGASLEAIKTASLVGRFLKAYDVEWRLLDLYVDTKVISPVAGLDYGFGVRATSTTTNPPPTQPTSTAQQPVPAGSGRVLIDPCLNLRSGPNGNTGLVGCVPKDTVLSIDCTAQGDSVTGPYGATTLWDHTTYNGTPGYLSDAWVYTGHANAVAGTC